MAGAATNTANGMQGPSTRISRKVWEGWPEDEAMDKVAQKRTGMSHTKWEASSADKQADRMIQKGMDAHQFAHRKPNG